MVAKRQWWPVAAALIATAACSTGSGDPAPTSATGTSPAGSVTTTVPADSAPPPTAASAEGDSAAQTAPVSTEPAGSEPASTEPAATDHVSGSAEELFDQTALHTFALTIDTAQLAMLDSNPSAEEYVEGVLSFNGTDIGPVGVRYKGSVGAFIGCTDGDSMIDPSGAKTCRKLSMKLKINWADDEAMFYEQRRIQLHSQNLDQTKMHERLGYWLFREMGVPAPRSTHARVEINGEYVGLFALTEQIDGRFTRANFDDGRGNLYKEVWPLTSEGEPQPAQKLLDALETNTDELPDADIMTGFAAEFIDASPDDRRAVLERWVDIDTLIRTFVVDRGIKNEDGALHWYCIGGSCNPHNFFWYEEPTERKVYLIPWDLDNALDALNPDSMIGRFIGITDPFGEISNDCQPMTGGGIGLQERSAACDPLIATAASYRDEFDRIRAELIDGPMSPESVRAQLAAWSTLIEPAVSEEAALHPDAPRVDNWQRAIEELKRYVIESRSGDGR